LKNESIGRTTTSQGLGGVKFLSHPSITASRGDNELMWPDGNDSDGRKYSKDIIDNASTYSNMSHSSLKSRQKKDTVRHAELLAATKVEDMMNDLNNVDSDQCEI